MTQRAGYRNGDEPCRPLGKVRAHLPVKECRPPQAHLFAAAGEGMECYERSQLEAQERQQERNRQRTASPYVARGPGKAMAHAFWAAHKIKTHSACHLCPVLPPTPAAQIESRTATYAQSPRKSYPVLLISLADGSALPRY